MSQIPRVVLDANVFVSAVINQYGAPRRILDAWKQQQLALLVAPMLLAEVGEVLRRPRIRAYHKLSDGELSDLFTHVLATAEVVAPLSPIPLTARDPDDNTFLAVALGGHATYLVTGDDDLLSLQGHEALGSLQIVAARDFLDRLTPSL